MVGAAVLAGALAIAGTGFALGKSGSSEGPSRSPLSGNVSSAGLSSTDPSTPGAPSHMGRHGVVGTLKSVNSDGTLTVTSARGGNDVKVTPDSNAKIIKVDNGSVADITQGALVTVHGTAANNGITAERVGILPAGTNLPNKPNPPKGNEANEPNEAAEKADHAAGTVQSVSNGTFVVQRADNTTVTVTTNGSTKVVKAVTVKVGDLTVGQPIAAKGTTNPDGSVSATSIVQGAQGLNVKGFGRFGRFGHFGHHGEQEHGPSAPSSNAAA
jgi:hypothetical protein